jgi:ferredoxin-thioredoxin reductase catalytic subunit
MTQPTREQIGALHEQLRREAEENGYHFNADREATLALVEGLLTNEARYGYRSCPCRLASGDKSQDLDIVCPCDYRDPDLDEYGACYCALYVSDEVLSGQRKLASIPERRPAEPKTPQEAQPSSANSSGLAIWRCRVCGYLCARESPPGICPICKAKKERFERLRLSVSIA